MSPLRRAQLGILALIVIVFSVNWLMRLTPLGNSRMDLTEDKIHTLSDGTRQILTHLDAPVILRYYASRNSEGIPRRFELYMRKVDDFIAEYKSIAGENLIIENIDPQPDTDAEDSASLDGMAGQRLNEYDNFFFGLSVQCLDKKKSLPFLNPNEETLLEYQLSSAIAEVAQSTKPVIGIMSAYDLGGTQAPPQMPGRPPQQAQRPWVIYQQLQQTYEVKDLDLNPDEIPAEITTLLLVHPAGVTPKTEFLLDQFVLGGGKLVALVDPQSVIAPALSGQMAQFGGGISPSSNLPTLLPHWGVTFTANEAIADAKYKQRVQGGTVPALLGLNDEAFVQPDELLTRGLNDLLLVISGGFTRDEQNSQGSYTPLVSSSKNAYRLDAKQAASPDSSLVGIKPDGVTYDFVARLQGSFKTAFPDGNPEKANQPEGQESDAEAEKEEKANTLTESTEPGAIFLIADVDWIFDQFSFSSGPSFGGTRIVQPTNGNSALFLNIMDQTAGSTALIGARSRVSSQRPFSRIEEMKAKAEERVGTKVRELQDKQEEAQNRINELQAQKSGADKLFLSPEQEAEIKDFREKNVAYRKEIRELQKELKADTDALEGRLFKYNVILLPLLVGLAGFAFLKIRSRSTRAA